MTPDAIRYELPYAQGLQLLSLQLYSGGSKFRGLELPADQTFSRIAGYN